MKGIKIRLKSSLINKQENTKEEIITTGIYNKNKIIYKDNDITYTIMIKDSKIVLLRENNEFKNSLTFIKNKKTTNDYLVKENSLNLEIDIKTNYLEINPNYIKIKYNVIDSNIDYEYIIEIEEKI